MPLPLPRLRFDPHLLQHGRQQFPGTDHALEPAHVTSEVDDQHQQGADRGERGQAQ
jgi:hypothetical protein